MRLLIALVEPFIIFFLAAVIAGTVVALTPPLELPVAYTFLC